MSTQKYLTKIYPTGAKEDSYEFQKEIMCEDIIEELQKENYDMSTKEAYYAARARVYTFCASCGVPLLDGLSMLHDSMSEGKLQLNYYPLENNKNYSKIEIKQIQKDIKKLNQEGKSIPSIYSDMILKLVKDSIAMFNDYNEAKQYALDNLESLNIGMNPDIQKTWLDWYFDLNWYDSEEKLNTLIEQIEKD